MSHLKGVDLNSSERFVYTYSGISQYNLEVAIDSMLQSKGYKHLGKGLYERGSRTMRILFGAFCKYFKFKVTLDASNPDELKVGLQKETTGMSGGLIGMNQVKKELDRLKEAFKTI